MAVQYSQQPACHEHDIGAGVKSVIAFSNRRDLQSKLIQQSKLMLLTRFILVQIGLHLSTLGSTGR
jgi:hypothetical protein